MCVLCAPIFFTQGAVLTSMTAISSHRFPPTASTTALVLLVAGVGVVVKTSSLFLRTMAGHMCGRIDDGGYGLKLIPERD